MTSLLNNIYITIKYGWPVIFIFFFFMAVAMLGFYIVDSANAEDVKKKLHERTGVPLIKMKYVLGGIDARQKPVYLAGYDGRNYCWSLFIRISSSCSKCLILFIKKGDYMPDGEKIFASNFIQFWVMASLSLKNFGLI